MSEVRYISGFGFGGDFIEEVRKELRKLDDDEVLIKNSAISLNPVDWKARKQSGVIIGVDGAGVAISAKDPRVNIGERYAYHCDLRYDGSFADYTIVKAEALIPIPQHISTTLASALPCAGLSAYQALDKVPCVYGKDVLVNGAGGMLGKILSSLLVLRGARVHVVASKMHHKELFRLGVFRCFDYDESLDFKFHAIFDTMGKAEKLLDKLSYYGHIVCILGRIKHNSTEEFSISPSLHEIALGAIHSFGSDEDFSRLKENARNLYNLILEGKILLPKLEIIDFSTIPQALENLKSGIKGVKFVAKL